MKYPVSKTGIVDRKRGVRFDRARGCGDCFNLSLFVFNKFGYSLSDSEFRNGMKTVW